MDILWIGRDRLIGRIDSDATPSSNTITVLDRGTIAEQTYLALRLGSEEGKRRAEKLGAVLFEHGDLIIVRRTASIDPSRIDLHGIRDVVPLRTIEAAPLGSRPRFSHMRPLSDAVVASLVSAVDEPSYLATIQSLEDFVTRHSLAPAYYRACESVADAFASYGLSVSMQEFMAEGTFGEPFLSWNVVAEKTGAQDPDTIVVICGHLDSTIGNPAIPQPVAPGADDNAGGAAAVLEMARIMSKHDFRSTLRFVCFGAEEQGLCGSHAYATRAVAAGDQIVGVVDLDMVLYAPAGHDEAWIPYDLASEPLAQLFASAAATYVPALRVTIEYAPDAAYSDHYAFWAAGYRAILAIEQDFSHNPYYHRTTDVLENYVQYFPFGTDCLRGALATSACLAQPLGAAAVADAGTIIGPGIETMPVHPHPVGQRARMALPRLLSGTVIVAVFDARGRAISRAVLAPQDANRGSVGLDFRNHASGTYFVKITDARGSSARKVVVAR